MKVQGSYTFGADLETVWGAMLSPTTLSHCLPGCEKFDAVGDDKYEIGMKVGISAFTGTYNGTLVVTDKRDLERYHMVVEGRGTGGAVKGEATVTFSRDGDHTQVSVVGESQVSGIIARVGQRLMSGASRMLMNQFFDCMKSQIEAPAATGAESQD